MCARRFLIAIFILTVLVVAAAFAIFQWGGNVLMRSATPKGHFVASAAGAGPDYGKVESWLARPELANNPAKWVPERHSNLPAGQSNHNLGQRPPPVRAAAFYVHPTTYLQRDRWNADVADKDSQARAALFLRSQASAFSDVADVWAPKYRQAAYGAFLLPTRDAAQALDMAYGDVRRAFDAFLAKNPTGPLILAAHSQGSLHLLRLLAERRDAIRGRLIAAYVVGWPVSRTADLPAIGLKPCAAPDATGCIMSWQSYAQPANPDLVLDAWEKMPGRSAAHRRRDIICTNPLSGTVDGIAEPVKNPGTLVPSADLSTATLAAGQVGAECERGLLMLNGAIPAMGPYVLPGNNYHVYDYALFWAGIARDAYNRTVGWR